MNKDVLYFKDKWVSLEAQEQDASRLPGFLALSTEGYSKVGSLCRYLLDLLVERCGNGHSESPRPSRSLPGPVHSAGDIL